MGFAIDSIMLLRFIYVGAECSDTRSDFGTLGLCFVHIGDNGHPFEDISVKPGSNTQHLYDLLLLIKGRQPAGVAKIGA